MKDDFSALDLLSIEGFRLSSVPVEPREGKAAAKVWRKKMRKLANGEPRRFTMPPLPKMGKLGKKSKIGKAGGKRRFSALLPLLGRGKTAPLGMLTGWPVRLSWPARDSLPPVDLSQDNP